MIVLEERIAVFLFGVAVGIVVYRVIIIGFLISRFPNTKCDYCEWHMLRRVDGEPFPPPKKSRHRK